ncbi:DUF1799 domain-containing protein [Allisonella histaminiformans]|uniref:DUF1799 domain-containing protein n=1 Tax=Allisonella histaminiformans TaxID=209880 RepID=UPI003A5237EA
MWELWTYSSTQLRTSFSGIIGIDYNAVFHIAECLGITITPGVLRKISILEKVLREKVNS